MASTAQRITLEVERKFVPHPNFISHFPRNLGSPKFKDLRRLPTTSFTDVYHDHNKTFDSKGIWLRSRNGKWQAKVRLGGNYTNSQFKELRDTNQIRDLVRKHVPQVNVDEPHFGLGIFAEIWTLRQQWVADGEFKIVHDSTDFGHEIGEVELERECEAEVRKEEQRRIVRQMDREIESFMDRYSWAFRTSSQRPVEKLTAYFARQKKLGLAD